MQEIDKIIEEILKIIGNEVLTKDNQVYLSGTGEEQIKQKLEEVRKKTLEEFMEKIEIFMINEFNYKGEYIEPINMGHGACCCCSTCGQYNDDCVCENNRIYNLLQTLSK